VPEQFGNLFEDAGDLFLVREQADYRKGSKKKKFDSPRNSGEKRYYQKLRVTLLPPSQTFCYRRLRFFPATK